MTVPAEVIERRRMPLWKALLAGALFGTIAACLTEIGRMAFFRNIHTVIPGRVYRSAQLKPDELRKMVDRHGIRTVINMRGRPFDAWYPVQVRTTQSLGISQEDIVSSANALPAAGEVRRLIEVFDSTEHPILIHCRQGADRTGLASAIYLMLYTDADYQTARLQCMPRFGHFPIHTAVAMDDFFDQYEAWLKSRGVSHSTGHFRQWATTVYAPRNGTAQLSLIQAPSQIDSGPVTFRVRAYNNSPEPWHLKAGTAAGVHLVFMVHNQDFLEVYRGRAGLIDRIVQPGESIDLDVPVPQLPPGKYVLTVDLSKRNIDFVKYGSEPLIYDWESRDPARLRRR